MPRIRFGAFELDLESGDLRTQTGAPIRLQPQPLKVLALLASRAGQVVTREELQREIWGQETYVDFDRGLNFCIKQIRAALGDDAQTPRYIETLPKRGYRFIVAVEPVNGRAAEQAGPAEAVEVIWGHARPRRRWPQIAAVAAGLAVVALLVTALVRPSIWRRSPRPAGKIMLAVLPFENLSGDASQEYVGDGLTEEMITQLGRLNPATLGVIARHSAMKYKGAREGAQQIGRELGVGYLLEGSARVSRGERPDHTADRLYITAQLIRVSDQTHLWAESYERPAGEIFAIQGEVAQRISRSLAVELLPAQQAALARASTRNTSAYEEYLQGRFSMNQGTEAGFRSAAEYYRQAIAGDSNYAMAYAGLADSYINQVDYRLLAPEEGYTKAREAVEKALQLDETLPEPHVLQAELARRFEHSEAATEGGFRRALELNPSLASAHYRYALYLLDANRLDEALREAEKARELDPLSPGVNVTLGRIHLRARRDDQAIAQFRKTIELDPNYPAAHYFLANGYDRKGMTAESLAEFQTALNVSGGAPKYVAALGVAYAKAGRLPEAQAKLDELKKMSKQRYVPPEELKWLSDEIRNARSARKPAD